MAYRGLWLWALLGILGLLFQLALHFKDTWVAHEPRLKPLVSSICQWAGCQISPLQKADAMVIDHASVDLMSEGSGWRLELNLRNTSTLPVASPWVELTLTDAQDKALMRKVFNPAETGGAPFLSPGEIVEYEWQLQLRQNDPVFVGYRLLTFYP